MSANNALVQQIRDFLGAKRADRAALVEEQTRLTSRRNQVATAPLCEEDFKAFLCGYIDSRGAEFIERVGMRSEIDSIVYPHRNQLDMSSEDRARPLGLHDVDQVLAGGDEQSVFHRNFPNLFAVPNAAGNLRYANLAAYFYLGEQMKSALLANFNAIYSEPPQIEGVPATLAERRDEVAAIDERLAEINRALASIDADIAEATYVPPDPAKAERVAAAAKIAEEDELGRESARLWNGRNEAEIATKLGISAGRVIALADRYSKPGNQYQH